jgi:hypothetical protein
LSSTIYGNAAPWDFVSLRNKSDKLFNEIDVTDAPLLAEFDWE